MKLTKKIKALIFAGIGIPVALAAPVVPVELKPIVWYVKDDGHCYVDFNDRGKVLTKEMSCEEYWKTARTPNYPSPKKTKLQSIFTGKDADAAIALDAVSNAGDPGAVTSFSFDHTVAVGSNLALIVGVGVRDLTEGDRIVNLVTYNSVAMATSAASDITGSNSVGASLYHLANPTIGTNSVTVTMAGGGTTEVTAASLSFSGVDQTTPVEAATSTIAVISSSQTATTTVTTLSDNAWMIAATEVLLADPAALSITEGTERAEVDTGSFVFSFGSYGPLSPAGVYKIVWTSTSAISWPLAGVALKPAAASTPPNPGTRVIFE